MQTTAPASLTTHGDRKYQGTTDLKGAIELPHLRVEHRRFEAGHHEAGICESNELAFVLSGRALAVQSANGATRRDFIQPGIACICPIGLYEQASGTTSPLDCLHIYLPPRLIERSAIADYEIDPAKAELLYLGGLNDPKLYQMAMAFHGALSCGMEATSRLFLDGLQAALAAYLLAKYSVDRWRRPPKPPDLETARLNRVLDYIEAHFAEDIALADLASGAGLGEFHFSRMFRKIVGVSPYRYVVFRRLEEAQRQLEKGGSTYAEIARATGFASQAVFTQVFRNLAGVSPRQYRAARAR